MEQRTSSDKRFALLIDADNVSARYIKPILDELSKYGTVTVKRIYGDWTLSLHAKWKDALLENSITPIQQFGYTQGKNATDSAMIIDAMDVLYTNSVDGFCIVSSDSDFTRLASRLREGGHMVIGMGEKKTPTPFRRACDVFTTLELLIDKREKTGGNGPSMSKDEVEQAVVDIITDNQNNGKATGLGEVGSRLLKRYPDFDVRSYGTNLLSKLLGEFPRIRITRDHNSIAVELADAPEGSATKAESASSGEGEAQNASKASSSVDTEPADEPVSAEAKTEDAPSSPAKRSRRSHRVSASSAHENAQAEPKPAAATETDAKAKEPAAETKADVKPVGNRDTTGETPVESPANAASEAPIESPANADDASVETSSAASETEDKPARKTSRRRRRKASDKAAPAEEPKGTTAETEAAENAAETEGVENAAEAEGVELDETPKDAAATASDAEPDSTSEAAPKPAPKKRGRKPKTKPQVDAQAADEGAQATPAPAKPEAPTASSTEEAPSEPTDKAKPKTRRGRKPKTRPAAEATPQDFIRQMVLDAGSTGVELSQIGDAVREKYKNFKVRDLGFSRLQHYVASIDDFAIEKVGKSTYVKLAE